MSANRLNAEVSPYLLQHKDNPVHWLPWGAEAFALAKEQDRPILLSVGYAACHWCHVMAHESFEDPDVAAVMNQLFVNIKVDREERPDIDQIYQAALAALGQSGGWPLTMFLTPEGEPFWGGTYFPPRALYGRPSFVDVLNGVAATYRQGRNKVRQNAGVLRDSLQRLSDNAPGDHIGVDVLDRIAERLLREVDPFHGGIGGAPKFPQTPLFELLWRAWLRTGREAYRTAAVNTLTQMCQGGIYDHLGGGFARYSTDERWLAPHFEKMLYDNAQLIRLLTLVWQETRTPLFEQRIRETVAWTLREMVAEGGGFAASLDADSEGEEGRFYVWREDEIDRLLGGDAAVFKTAYDVTGPGNWEDANILNRLRKPALGSEEAERALAEMRDKLLSARAARQRPGWDDKVLADWNGMMITALTDAALALGEPAWRQAAQRAYDFVREKMVIDGRLRHAARAGVIKHLANVDDLANMSRAALALFEATGERRYLDDAENWVATLDAHHWDAARGGYFFTAADAAATEGAPVICQVKTAHDASTPAGNGVLLLVLNQLHAATGEDCYRDRAQALLTAFTGEIAHNFFPLPTLLNSAEAFYNPLQIVLVSPQDGALDEALAHTIYRHSLPDRMIVRAKDGADLPVYHPAHGKSAIGGKPTAYVCRGRSCAAPVTTPDELAALLAR